MSRSWCNHSRGSFPLSCMCTPLDSACNKECVKLRRNHPSPCLHCTLILMQKHTVCHTSITVYSFYLVSTLLYLGNEFTQLHWLIHKAMDPVCLGGNNNYLVEGKEGKSVLLSMVMTVVRMSHITVSKAVVTKKLQV